MISRLDNALGNVYKFLKHNYPNAYILLMSVLITLWFHHFMKVAVYFIPQNKLWIHSSILLGITLLLYFGDGSLDELYSFELSKDRRVDTTKQKFGMKGPIRGTLLLGNNDQTSLKKKLKNASQELMFLRKKSKNSRV